MMHDENPEQYPIRLLVKFGEVSFQAYYKWLKRYSTNNEQFNELLMTKIQQLDKQHKHNLGVKRMTMYLNMDTEINYRVNHKRVRRLMHRLGIRADIRKKRRNRIKANEQFIIDNLMNQDFKTQSPNQKWATDMTELRFGPHLEHVLRLSATIDLYGTYILSFNISKTETSQSAVQTLQRAYQFAGNPTDVLVHSDRGTAYTSRAFKNLLSQHHAQRSMSRPGTPYDNAVVEKFWNDFKIEWWDKQHSDTLPEAVKAIKLGVDYFNHVRRSDTIKGHTPEEFRNMALYDEVIA